jgi:hypothetical protein
VYVIKLRGCICDVQNFSVTDEHNEEFIYSVIKFNSTIT